MTTQNMVMAKDKFRDARHFIESLSLKDEDVRKILAANDWEKDFILQRAKAVSYTHLTLPTNLLSCRSRWSPYH